MSEPQEPHGQSSAGEQGWPTQPLPRVPSAEGAPDPGPHAAGAGAPGPQWQHAGAPYHWGPYAAYPPQQAPRRRGRVTAALVGVALVAAGAGAAVGHVVWHTPPTGQTVADGAGPIGVPDGSGAGGGASQVSAVAQKLDPALVDVDSTFSYQSAKGAGTGIVLTSNGEILTNNHVINGATSISVTDVGNGATYAAYVVGYDHSHDIAVLQLQGATGLTTADIGDSSSVSVGQAVVALGNAGGAGGIPSSAGGSVTGLDKSITASDELDGTDEQLSGLIQVDADVRSGDSGGSLANTSGQVIGIDTAASQSYSLQSQGNSAATGAGFAIPIDSALSIAKQIEAGQSSSTVHVGQTAFLGVLVQTANGQGDQSGANGFGGGAGTVSGAQVTQVLPNGAALQAGLGAGDVITALDGQSVGSASDLSDILGGLAPGQSVPIAYTDGFGQSQNGTVQLTSGPPA